MRLFDRLSARPTRRKWVSAALDRATDHIMKRTLVISIALGVFVLSCLFPPVVKLRGYREHISGAVVPSYYVTYEFIGAGSRIDAGRLLIQWAMLFVATTMLLCFPSAAKRGQERQGQKDKGTAKTRKKIRDG